MGLFQAIKRAVIEGPWQDMSTAPRDGTLIEIKCSYGYQPWIDKGRWKQDAFVGPIWEFRTPDGITYISGPDAGKKEDFVTYIQDRDDGARSNGANNSTLQWRPL